MNEIKQKLQTLLNALNNVSPESLNMSLFNVHAKGMFSLVINGEEHGKLTRVFIATEDLSPFTVQLHSHSYALDITAIAGEIRQHVAKENMESSVQMPLYWYTSPLNGGKGLVFEKTIGVDLSDFAIPVGSSMHMNPDEIHTISCKQGAIWFVEEHGFERGRTKVVGVPFSIDGLYTKPQQFQINDMHQIVQKALRQIIMHFNLIEI